MFIRALQGLFQQEVPCFAHSTNVVILKITPNNTSRIFTYIKTVSIAIIVTLFFFNIP